MQIISVSMGTYGGGKELAQRLAEKMDYQFLTREDLIEAATREGIRVGKLEMAMIKPRAFTEQLARERDHYLAFSRWYLCERATQGSLVYCGRTGHLLLPGVSHVLRVRVVWDVEHRIQTIMARMGLDRETALRYIREVDEDRARWARAMYGISLEEAINYDVTVNLQQMSVENAASSLMAVAQLPDFQMTPASRRAMEDLHLGAAARLALARDKRTFKASPKVRADAGVVTVSYTPQDAAIAPLIPEVLETVPGIRDLRITMATANLLWIQERFEPHSETFKKVVEVATKWNAAVELVRLVPEGPEEAGEEASPPGSHAFGISPGSEAIRSAHPSSPAPPAEVAAPSALSSEGSAPGVGTVTGALAQGSDTAGEDEYDGGIEADEPDEEVDDGGLEATLGDLAQLGRSGGGRTVFGSRQRLVETLDRTFPYTLVVVGDVFLSKGHAARMRATRDLRSFLSDRVRAPVVTADELGSQYLFGRREAVRAAFFTVITLALYFLVFTNQEAILAFLANQGWYAEWAQRTVLGRVEWLPRLLISLALVLFIPVVAFSYGRVAGAFLKLIKME